MNSFAASLRFPAEWEKHEATWIAWPHNSRDWPGKFHPIPWVYSEIVRYIARGEIVRILIQDKIHRKKAESILKASGTNFANVEFHTFKTDRSWLRDSAPVFVKNSSETVAVHFKFNGWAKYDNYKNDMNIPLFIAGKQSVNLIKATYESRHVVLEGGSIDTNGNGTLITTEECLLDEAIQPRNPGFAKKEYEKIFTDLLGIKNTVWLGKGIVGDDTHGHVDDLCRFVNKNTIILVQEDNPDDQNYKVLNENRERLQDARLEDGTKPEIIFLPMPAEVIFKGERLPASYANFYISNFAVLVPTFNDPNDRIALGILSEIITDRPVIGIHSVDLVWGLGTLHCLTHEQPL